LAQRRLKEDRNMLPNLLPALSFILVIQLHVPLCLLTATPAIAASQQRSISLDDEGRLHISASDVMILDASFRDVVKQLETLNATLLQEIETRDRQIAALQNNSCVPIAPSVRFNATAATLLAKLVASSGAEDDWFGYALAATDDMVVVGALYADDKGSDSGSVYVFEKNSTDQYQQVSKLVASDGAAGDWFGYAVAAAESMVVVGARQDGSGAGSVYVFERNSTGQYGQVSKLVASDSAAGDNFGNSLAATDGTVVVGAFGDDDKGSDTGSVYVFEKNSTGQYQQTSKLVASDGAADDNFGGAVAVADGMVVVGATRDGDKGADSGSVYVFEKNSAGQYEQVSKLVASDGASGDRFGRAVAVAAPNDTVVVGSPSDDDEGSNSGSVYVFEKNSAGQYQQVSKLVASDGNVDDKFGYDLAATDGMIVVGAANNDDKGSDSGSVYVFEKNSAGQYHQVRKLVASDGAAGDYFGHAVAVTRGMVVIAAVEDDDKGSSSGSVYVFG
jgi:Ni,Fe-hydrogenase maturation factor